MEKGIVEQIFVFLLVVVVRVDIVTRVWDKRSFGTDLLKLFRELKGRVCLL